MKEVLKKNKELIVAIFVVLFLIISGSYAWYTLTKTSEKVNTIKAGSLSMVLDDKASDGILLQKAIPMSYQQGVATTEYTFTLKNNGSKGDYTISLIDEATYTDSEGAQVTITADKKIADTKIRYILLKDGEVAEASKSMLLSEAANRVIDSGTIANGTTINYSLRIWIDSKAENEVMGQIFNARLQLDATQHQDQTAPVVPTYNYTNLNIKAAYNYDAVNCITGEEETCEQISLTSSDTNISAGTIIKYKVNDTEEKYFHVLHDDGATITMQQRENIVYNTAWYAAENNNSYGPTTILPVLENETSGWTNVNDQTYTMGTTTFKTNNFTGCDANISCASNTYTLDERTAKARMITVQEAADLGCTVANKSCPNWMNNYLYESTSYGGTVNDDTTANGGDHNFGYWTMSASSDSSTSAWYVNRGGYLRYYGGGTSYTYYGARAVVVIFK